MKVSREQVAQNRERILDVAAALFRERGIDGLSVADLMKSAGLTHGGFYGYFDSKEDLVAQACRRAVVQTQQSWIGTIAQSETKALAAIAQNYLAAHHRDKAGLGCLFAA